MQVTTHASDQMRCRAIPEDVALAVIDRKLTKGGWRGEDVAVYLGRTNDRGALIGSNGDQVWAIIRGGRVHTVMLRRSDQPSTPQALRVRRVFGKEGH